MKILANFRTWQARGGIRPWLYLPFAFAAFFCLDMYLRTAFWARNPWDTWVDAPMLGSCGYCLLFVAVSLILPAVWGRVFLAVSFAGFALLTLTHGILQTMFRKFFMFSALSLASDGFSFLNGDYLKIPPLLQQGLWISLACILLALLLMPTLKKRRMRLKLKQPRMLLGTLFALAGFACVLSVNSNALEQNKEISWDSYTRPAAVYDTFTDSTGSLFAAGLYQYTFRDIHLYFNIDNDLSTAEKKDLDAFAKERKALTEDNDYTATLKGKNVIMVQLEAIDTWMLTEDYMPNLYALKEKSIQFQKHFTPAYITAGTINTEFIANTGMIPATGRVSISTHERNSFPLSLANLFRAEGYRAHSFHGSEGNVYNRGLLHPNLGYEQYHSGKDMDMNSYMLDRHLMAGYEDMTKKEPFFSFVITYSGHGPYSDENGIFKNHAEQARKVAERDEDNYIWAVGHAMETDLFVKNLVERLEEDELLEDTVLIFYADHYNYYMLDDPLIMEIKAVDDLNLLQQTDFFIYSQDQSPVQVEKVTSSLDIVPTLANLFDLKDDEAVYLGTDGLGKAGGYVFFADASFYTGDSKVIAPTEESTVPPASETDAPTKSGTDTDKTDDKAKTKTDTDKTDDKAKTKTDTDKTDDKAKTKTDTDKTDDKAKTDKVKILPAPETIALSERDIARLLHMSRLLLKSDYYANRNTP